MSNPYPANSSSAAWPSMDTFVPSSRSFLYSSIMGTWGLPHSSSKQYICRKNSRSETAAFTSMKV